MRNGYIRVAAATPEVKVADCKFNSDKIIELINKAAEENTALVVFPELCVTAYTCGELFNQKALINEAEQTLLRIAQETAGLGIISVIGVPLLLDSALMNCAAIIYKGEILGIVPKTFLPTYTEFYEERFFTTALKIKDESIRINGMDIPFGTDLIFCCDNFPLFKFAVEICEDLWVPKPPSIDYAIAGATVICNLSASNETVGKSKYRRSLVNMQSAKLICSYIYSDSGFGESTTDLVYSGHNIISERGIILAEKSQFEPGIIYADTDLSLLSGERQRLTTFKGTEKPVMRKIFFTIDEKFYQPLLRKISPYPFVPENINDREIRCEEILSIQSEGLRKRIAHTNTSSAVIGLSGGLDSTLALLVTVRAFDRLNLSREGILAVTMPCFGTTDRTYNNAIALAKSLGVTLKEICISDAVLQHFKDINHDVNNHDVTYENSQARERTQVLMDLANKTGGLVVGTGDLSELALGWATYNGDHMSMYGVNASIPKTLVRYLIDYVASKSDDTLKNVLYDILNTPVSPELLPPKEGQISQKTEDIVGPYELHDFYLFYTVRYGFEPDKVKRLAQIAFKDKYANDVIEKWLRTFYRRFFSQQFKRSCLPDGPKVGSVSLSPRGDWRMPSDASSALWLDILDNQG